MVTYNICYDISAFVMLLLIILLFLMRRGISNYQNRLFFTLIFCAFLGTIADICDILFINAGNTLPNVLKYISSGSCFVFHGLEALLVLFYFLGITNSWWKIKNGIKFVLVLPYIIIAFLIVTSFYTHLIYYYDASGIYHRGSACILTYLLALIYLVIAAVYICHLRKFLSRETQLILILITIIAATGAIIQLTIPGLSTQMFATAMCLYIIFFTLQNPYLAIDNYLRVYNRSSFVNMAALSFATGKKMSMILLAIDDYVFLQSSFGVEQVRELQSEIAKSMKALDRNILIYHVSDACFCVVLNSNYQEQKTTDLMNRMEKLFDKTWEINEISTILSVHLCRINCPKDADSVERIFEIISCLLEQKQNGKRIYIEDMDLKGRNSQRQKEQLIKEAILNESYEICYRGLYSILTQKTDSVEIALRIKDENKEYLYSDESKELQEKTGMIFKVGIILFREACRFINKYAQSDMEIDSVEIGISIFLCMQQEYLLEIAALMKEYKIKPGMIRLKISESEAMDTTIQLQEMMKRFSEIGIWFSLDGYGTGYSNISYIYQLPFSHIEMDKEVFKAALLDEKAMEILVNTIQMLHELDMQVIICDVPNEKEKLLLKNIRCDYVVETYRPL